MLPNFWFIRVKKMREMQKSVILSERLILQALNFDLNVMQPYSYLQTKMKEWKSKCAFLCDLHCAYILWFADYTTDESRRALLQTAVNFMNDRFVLSSHPLPFIALMIFVLNSFRSTFCLEYRPSEIGAASLYLATVALSMTPITTSSNSRAPAIATVELSWIDLLTKDVEEYRLRCKPYSLVLLVLSFSLSLLSIIAICRLVLGNHGDV